jgi:trk system potassium uptake protein TrkH
MNNIGFGVGRFSPSGNLGGLDSFSKVVLCFDMLLGRLEIYPLILLFAARKDRI